LLPFLDGESSFKDPQRIPACLLTKILILTRVTQVLLHPGQLQYPLGDREKWPKRGHINYNTILQLDMFCKKGRKVD
jgi:hypothetical protein